MTSSTSVDVAGAPLTTNVAIFWVAGTKPAAAVTNPAQRTPDRATGLARTAADRKAHWEQLYRVKAPAEVSWFQAHAERSLQMIGRTGVDRAAPILDVGGGTSPLVDELLDRRYTQVTVLDLAGAALRRARERLGGRAARVEWLEADITTVELAAAHYAVWHDRAVFHFLTGAPDRRRYIACATAALQPRGQLILATFAADGPTACSGLATVRYSPEALQDEFGPAFELVESAHEGHKTPFGTQQSFLYCRFRKRA